VKRQTNGRTPRPRDASETQRLLLEAARQRFASDGYAATTVRQIADDVGVNVALISRYFESKEGLFEACLASAARSLFESVEEVSHLGQLAEIISRHATDVRLERGLRPALLVLLRSSGDERAEEIRIATLRRYGECLAALAGWTGEPGSEGLLLRAQLVLATAIGVVILRSQSRIEPLASATKEELSGHLDRLVNALFISAVDER
jgi:AcrR family transcriptional regulator